MYEVKRLQGHPSAQCKVILTGKAITLVSYTTEVIRVSRTEGGFIMACTGLYSMTTRKHIGYFLKEYYPNVSYQDIKAIAGTGESIILDIYGVKHDGIVYNRTLNELILDE